MSTNTLTEATVREAIAEVVLPVYKGMGFRRFTMDNITRIILDPEQSKRKRDDISRASIAAEKVRSALWSYSGGTTSASVTCVLFTKLGRESELGYLLEEGGLCNR